MVHITNGENLCMHRKFAPFQTSPQTVAAILTLYRVTIKDILASSYLHHKLSILRNFNYQKSEDQTNFITLQQ